MIQYLEIENFKSLSVFAEPLKKLNLFFGLNGAGKSSVIQSLLLLRQSYRLDNKAIDSLILNDRLINLGSAKEVLSENASDDYIRFALTFDNNSYADFQFEYDSSSANTLERKSERVENCYKESLFSTNFCYLGAEHIGPRRQYDISTWADKKKYNLGIHGEYTVPFLAEQGDKLNVADKLCLDTVPSHKLIDQVSAWMSLISPGVKISAEIQNVEQYAKLMISYAAERLYSEKYSPVNVGFGIPYVLPLIVDLLVSDENSLCLIENPESHLHPRGQAEMGRLIALAAANGAQILCESHSDHLINGIRVSVKEQFLDPKDLSILYFDRGSNQETVVHPIRVDSKGALSVFPEGFLDEWGILMSKLL